MIVSQQSACRLQCISFIAKVVTSNSKTAVRVENLMLLLQRAMVPQIF